MPRAAASDPKFEIRHILFIDIVGYSKLLIDDQTEAIQQLNRIVAGTAEFRAAEAENYLVRLPTGDGMALIFRNSAEAPVRCAMQIAEAVTNQPKLQLRMGVHSGPVSEVMDVNNQVNLAGAGLNIAQRIMDCGDAGHILLSKRAAEDLQHYARWQASLHDLGECEVKHSTRVGIVSLHDGRIGNAQVPARLKQNRSRKPIRARLIRDLIGRNPRLFTGAVVAIAALLAGGWMIARLARSRSHPTAPGGNANRYTDVLSDRAKWSRIYGSDHLLPTKAVFRNIAVWDRRTWSLAPIPIAARSCYECKMEHGRPISCKKFLATVRSQPAG
jgi:class 3 adenylate cyclase